MVVASVPRPTATETTGSVTGSAPTLVTVSCAVLRTGSANHDSQSCPPGAIVGEDPEVSDGELAACSARVAFVDAALPFFCAEDGDACNREVGGGSMLSGEVQRFDDARASHGRFGDGE